MTVRIYGELWLAYPLEDRGRQFARVAVDFLIIWMDENGKEHPILTPAGMWTDGNSVPDWIPGMDSNTGLMGAVVHDGLYERKEFSKEICDQIAGELWELDPRVSSAKRILMLAGLNSDIARRIYDPDFEPPTPGEEVDD